MMSWMNRPAGIAGILVAAIIGIPFALTAHGGRVSADVGSSTRTPSLQQVEKGRYLVRAGDCVACHSSRGGQPFAGNRPIPTPFGMLYSSNITPDKATGIGTWTEEDFWTALHEGKGRHGRLLYPAFPYTAYTHVKRADADAMYVYLRTLDPVHSVTHAPSLRFPFSLRTLLLAWRALYFDPGVFKPDPDKSAQWNRGAYLVKGLGHCSACHTARNVLGAQKSGQHLRGGLIPVEGWYAPGLGVESDGSLAGWSARDIHDLLKTGRSSRGTAYGPMADVVQGSLQYLDDKDLYAIADYLRSLPRRPSRSKPDDSASGGPLSQEEVEALLAAGKRIFHRRCSACHQDHGQGVPHVYPKLAGNSVVMSPNPVNCVRVVMLGGFEPTTRTYPRPYSMPPFMQQLSDRQVAAVVSYIRQSWGNAAGAVSPQEVRKYRSIPLQ